jgi:conjugal transfer pilus assembly protein TraF
VIGRRPLVALAIAMSLSAAPAFAQGTASRRLSEPAPDAPRKQGYWWYEAPKPSTPAEDDPEALHKPAIPPMARTGDLDAPEASAS